MFEVEGVSPSTSNMCFFTALLDDRYSRFLKETKPGSRWGV